MNDFQKLTIWETVFVGAKPENVQKWFSNQEKDFLINISIILIVVGKVHWKVRNLSKLFPKSVKGEISIKTSLNFPVWKLFLKYVLCAALPFLDT